MLFDRSARIAFIVACLTLIGSGVAFQAVVSKLNIYLRKEPVELRQHFTTIHRSLGNWQAITSDAQFDAAMIESLGTDIYLDRNYALNGDPAQGLLMFHLAYYTGMIDAIPHVPDRCMVAGGFNAKTLPTYIDLPIDTSSWLYDEQHINQRSGKPYPYVHHRDPVRGNPITVRMPIGDFQLRTTEFSHPDHRDMRIYAGFFFIANGHITASPYQVRALAFDRTDKYAYYNKVQFTTMGPSDMTMEDFGEHVTDLLQHLLPEIMRCLPDWAEVEASQHEGDNAVEDSTAAHSRNLSHSSSRS
jgi:hypothetical protein